MSTTTTTNYGWTIPNNDELVKDGAAAIRTLGNAADSSLKTVSDGRGLIHIKSYTPSAVSSISLDANTFTSTYRNYKIIFSNITTSNNNNPLRFRYRASGTDTTSNTYYRYGMINGSAAFVGAYELNTGCYFGNGSSTSTSTVFLNLDIYNPQVATRTHASFSSIANSSEEAFICVVNQSATTQFDSMTFYCDSGTLSGSIQVFAYKQ